MTGRPVIGICARTAPVTLQGATMMVNLALQSHVDYLAAAGCTPVLIPLLPGAGQVLSGLDGLLIPGGPDLDPALYGATPHLTTRTGSPAMDAAELALVREALDIGMPTLAICRGMQLLNVLHGGTLHQHLPEVTGNDGHCPEPTVSFGRHPLETKPGSRIAQILADDDAPETACRHHQAIDQIGAGLIPTGWSPDGVVEVLEVAHHPFAIGVQWEAGQTEDQRLHHALAEAAERASPRTATVA
ncbi:gamma-glutamyl-gamma-aminobutyrate hydrolase family protein [Kibdelosporangium aridum]|uniref:gamma-glutamyl-gamma-aminobutyrate hydrolase family protein n=1 Tax=Kibdelosporangium aridum TaxID=2030 RepID=UPI000A8FBB24|nr:gamma-glutamyl-gamma-aminobutyrate hydrolase family protein [Kibdelosporangium aridum]